MTNKTDIERWGRWSQVGDPNEDSFDVSLREAVGTMATLLERAAIVISGVRKLAKTGDPLQGSVLQQVAIKWLQDWEGGSQT